MKIFLGFKSKIYNFLVIEKLAEIFVVKPCTKVNAALLIFVEEKDYEPKNKIVTYAYCPFYWGDRTPEFELWTHYSTAWVIPFF